MSTDQSASREITIWNRGITLLDVACTGVIINPWCHSGVVSATLTDVNLEWLLDKLDESEVVEYYNQKNRNT